MHVDDAKSEESKESQESTVEDEVQEYLDLDQKTIQMYCDGKYLGEEVFTETHSGADPLIIRLNLPKGLFYGAAILNVMKRDGRPGVGSDDVHRGEHIAVSRMRNFPVQITQEDLDAFKFRKGKKNKNVPRKRRQQFRCLLDKHGLQGRRHPQKE